MMDSVGMLLGRSDLYGYFKHDLYVSMVSPNNIYSFIRNYLLDYTIIKSVGDNRSLEKTQEGVKKNG